MKKIALSLQGKNKGKYHVLVDDEDFDCFNKFRWAYHQGYAVRRGKRKLIIMHREIMNPLSTLEIDHINGNKLDNRRVNLRMATRSENSINKTKQINNTSGYKGVSWNKTLGYWHAYIKINKKRIHLGWFKTKEKAAEAYNKATVRYHGEFRLLNKII